jgi:uncharacterized FlaG/YvyC family protein
MASTLPFSYPLDPSGSNPANLVVGEIHTTLNRSIRAVVTNYGAFFGGSMVIKDLATGLNLNTSQWYPAQLYTQPTLQFGSPIYSLIMITDGTVSDNIALTYQAVGGPYSTSQQALVDYINNLDLDSRPVSWPAIINKPDGYTPSPHLQDVGTVYGFEYIVQSLDRLTYAIQVGDAAYNDSLLAYVDAQNTGLSNELAALQAQLTAHINNISNPHQVTAAQVGAYTKSQSDSNLSSAVATLNTSIGTVQTNLTTHINNISNPHEVTAAQVGAYTTAQSDSNLNAAVTTLNTSISTVQTNLTSHTSNTNNPHQVTAAQVGAMTTAQTNSAIAAASTTLNTSITTVQNNLTSHVQNTSNPHATTAAQVGAYTTTQSDANLASAVSTLNASIATKAAASLPFAYQNNTVTFADIHASGTIYSSNDVWAFNSDERIKRDFKSIADPLSLIMQLGGYFHRYKPEFAQICAVDPEDWYVGVKAQEVEKVLPMIVGLAPFDRDTITGESISGENYLTVQYERLAPLFIEAIKHLSNELGQVKMELEKLQRLSDTDGAI